MTTTQTLRAPTIFAFNFELALLMSKGWKPRGQVDKLELDYKFNNNGDEWVIPFRRYAITLYYEKPN